MGREFQIEHRKGKNNVNAYLKTVKKLVGVIQGESLDFILTLVLGILTTCSFIMS